MTLRTIDSLGSLSGKRVIVRCDLNVPLQDGVITDDGRIRASLPTLNRLIHAGASVVVHLPPRAARTAAPTRSTSLAPVAQRLSRAPRPAGDVRERHRRGGGDGGRRRAGRRRRRDAGEPAVQRRGDQQGRGTTARRSPAKLAAFGDAFVSDGFGVVHRKQASVYELARPAAERRRAPDRRGAGRARPAHRRLRRRRTRSSSAARRCRTSSA